MTTSATAAIPDLVEQLYDVVARLEALFPGRHFTLDGHLVGSIGEVLAASRYALTLLPAGTRCHDATTDDGRLVQIKATQGKSVGLYEQPDYLLVLQLTPEGSITEIYNGPGACAWEAAGRMQRNGQRAIGVAKLRDLTLEVPAASRILERG